jgi:alpha-tubulin suppressor-like RCC1 family protein
MWKQISCGLNYSASVQTNGTLWAWGLNSSGQLGDNTITNKSSPIQIGSLTNWTQVSCGENHTAAIKTDGTLWAWGLNSSGQVGDGTQVSRSSPVQISSMTTWTHIECGDAFSIGQAGGMLYGWGHNLKGHIYGVVIRILKLKVINIAVCNCNIVGNYKSVNRKYKLLVVIRTVGISA